MKKEEAIQIFKDNCADPINYAFRQDAVEHQFHRRIWQFDDLKVGRIWLQHAENDKFFILVFHLVGHGYGVPSVFEISEQEYNELKSLFFGDFKEDTEYLKKLNNLK